MVRGRQGRIGLTGMSLSTFLDLVWTEIWDDAPSMGDRGQYRRVMKQLFLDGTAAHDIWYDTYDDKGKKIRKRLDDVPAETGGEIPKSAKEQMEEMRQRALEAAARRAEAKESE